MATRQLKGGQIIEAHDLEIDVSHGGHTNKVLVLAMVGWWFHINAVNGEPTFNKHRSMASHMSDCFMQRRGHNGDDVKAPSQ